MRLTRFALYAWGVLAYNLVVILWGAFVRATGSGAGCGSHWPLCNGTIVPRAPQLETIIEFVHRASSGLALLLVVGLYIWARRRYQRGHELRLGATLALLFIISEALVGAGLVLFEWVAQNESMARAYSMSVHLLNTFLLLAALTITAWWASGGRPVRLRGQGAVSWLLGLAFGGMLLLGVTGALIALGDTLYSARSLAEAERQLSPTLRLLVGLRPLHPALALLVGLYLVFAAGLMRSMRPGLATRRLSWLLTLLFFIQLGAGALNVLLQVPIWLQLVHLLLADLIWIALVLLAAAALAVGAPQAAAFERAGALAPGAD